MNNGDQLKTPIPLRKKIASDIRLNYLTQRPSSTCSSNVQTSINNNGTKKAKCFEQTCNNYDEDNKSVPKARSATPAKNDATLFNGMDSEELIKKRLANYSLDFVDDHDLYLKNVYDSNSKWFSRDVKPDFLIEKCLPYPIENYKDQAKYLCHILVNLYIAIQSFDIQGLLAISSKDLCEFKAGLDALALDTDMFKLSAEDGEMNDINTFDEEDDEFEEDENEYIDTSGPDFNATGKITATSATIINVNHWTNELRNCLHFDFPLTLRKSLAKVYYHLALVRGQKIFRQMHVDMFESLVMKDDEGTNFTSLLLSSGLKLDYRPLLEFLQEFFPTAESDYIRYHVSNKSDLQLFRLLLKHAHNSKVFYDQDDEKALSTVVQNLISSYAPSTVSIVSPIITSFIPYYYQTNSNITDFFPFVFSIWTSSNANTVIDTHSYDFVGCVSEDAYINLLTQESPRLLVKSGLTFGNFGLLTEQQMKFLFNRVQNHLRNDFQIYSFSRTVRPFIYSINGSDFGSFFNYLEALLKSVETFIHPSNTGNWTKICAKFIHAFIKMYHQRAKLEEDPKSSFRSELKLNNKTHENMVKIFLKLLNIGSLNKSSDMANYYISSFAYLLDLSPPNKSLILDNILIDVYESLTDQYVHSIHRTYSALKKFTRVVRYMVMDDLYRVHVTNILSMMVSKLDHNDILLTSNLINGIVSIASFIPFENFTKADEYFTFESHTLPFIQEHLYYLKEGNNSSVEFNYNKEVLDVAFRASTTVFENVLKVYLDKVFLFVDADFDSSIISKINQTSMIMIESMSDDVFMYFFGAFEKLLWDSSYIREKEPNYELLSITIGAIIKRDNRLARKLFQNLAVQITQELDRGAGSIRSSTEIQHRDVRLVAYISCLCELLRQAHESLLTFKRELISLLHTIYDSITNPPIDIITSLLVHNVLTSLTTTEVIENRLIPKDSDLNCYERWGGLQFDSRKFSKKNLTFDWHVPTSAEIDLAIEILEDFSDYAIEYIQKLITDPQPSNKKTDLFKKCILILTHVLSGASLLFDPDYNKEKTKYQIDDKYNSKLLLLKNLRENELDGHAIDIDIEPIKQDKDLTPFEDNGSLTDVEIDGSKLNEIQMATDKEMDGADDVLMEYEGGQSEIPSGLATPIPHEEDGANHNSIMSSEITFRELNIFRFNYFFGNTRTEKLGDLRYLKVHKLRADVGNFFHKIYLYLSSNYDNNTQIFQIFLHGLKVWFADVGQETIFSEDASSFLELEFLENIQSLAHVNEPYTRTFFGARVNAFHQSRVLLNSTNRVPSKLEKLLLKDIIHLSMSIYPDIFKPAQGCMVHTIKQLIGSYQIVITKILSSFEEALQNKSYKKISVILQVLNIKKINRKLFTDYNNLSKIFKLLCEASTISDDDISSLADELLNNLGSCFKIPSSVCLMDHDQLECINPGDDSISLQVSVVRKAKDKKRRDYISKLIELNKELIDKLNNSSNLNWRITLNLIKIITRLEASLELPINDSSLLSIFKMCDGKHPDLLHSSLKSVIKIIDKISLMSAYQYNLNNAFDPKFRKQFTVSVGTKRDFSAVFQKEMNNFKCPNYFIDNIAYVGWLCWGQNMDVVETSKQIEWKLNNENDKILRDFGSLLTKKWLRNVLNILIKDNETKSYFISSDVELFVIIIHLINAGYCCPSLVDDALTYEFILETCDSIFDKNDKASMIMSIEIMCALIAADKFTTEKNVIKRDTFMDRFLTRILDHELNQDSMEVLNIAVWWIPMNVDIRRCPVFYEKFSSVENLLDVNSDASADQSSKLNLLRQIISTLGWRSPDLDKLVGSLIFNHPYDQVRRSIAFMYSTILRARINLSMDGYQELLDYERSSDREQEQKNSGLGRPTLCMPDFFARMFTTTFERIDFEFNKVKHMLPQDVLKTDYYYMSSTMIDLISSLLASPSKVFLISYLKEYIGPFFSKLDSMKDVCKLANIDPGALYMTFAYLPIRKEYIESVVSLIDDKSLFQGSHGLRLQLTFFESIFSNNLFTLGENEKKKILKFVVLNLYDSNSIEVRLRASDVLSGIVHNIMDKGIVNELTEKFTNDLVSKKNNKIKDYLKGNKSDEIKIHGSIIGLGGIISAYPYVFPLPKWIPAKLSILSSWAKANGICGNAAKDIISEFKKVRSDTWHLDREHFTTDELEDLEGVLWRSYYA
ncbi:related to Proteasome activator BLM10 [Saccharomycodes ludwigii]|uniref:Related to Proteasome activator BLM10 n=1 Tax=Saccharomycodes ludwigii TaxID=36035 RepID=A0A376B1A2_9ASCO|nr:hypothetical protein SCDLUD_000698 [Saccharomycodes ludwigii]KAH3903087.1 hypothetical protein SCDLUD_000698 [Saccharomycodes ludwigii]SSD58422.1 related to Proteasome activator BLM10 [Saccharomycodes ludwigii]